MFAKKNKDIVQRISFDINHIDGARQSARTHAFEKRKERIGVINNTRNDQDLKIGDLVYVKSLENGKLGSRIHESKARVLKIVSKNIVELVTEKEPERCAKL